MLEGLAADDHRGSTAHIERVGGRHACTQNDEFISIISECLSMHEEFHLLSVQMRAYDAEL